MPTMISGPSRGIACRPMVEVSPTASPRFSVATSLLTMWKVSGGSPPSASPISARAASRVSRPTARPELIEASEKITVAATSSSLLLPVRSAARGSQKLDSDQVTARTRVDQPDIGVGQVEFGLDHRREQAERRAVEEHDAEVDPEQPDEQRLVARASSAPGRSRSISDAIMPPSPQTAVPKRTLTGAPRLARGDFMGALPFGGFGRDLFVVISERLRQRLVVRDRGGGGDRRASCCTCRCTGWAGHGLPPRRHGDGPGMSWGMALIVAGIALAAWGLLPKNVAAQSTPRATSSRRARGRAARAGPLAADGGPHHRARHRRHEAGEPRLRHPRHARGIRRLGGDGGVVPVLGAVRHRRRLGALGLARRPLRPPRVDPAVGGDVRRHLDLRRDAALWWNVGCAS